MCCGFRDFGGIYMMSHLLFFPVRRMSAARVACSNTSRTPSFILAEHSRYFAAPILRATASPYNVSTNITRTEAQQGHSHRNERVGRGIQEERGKGWYFLWRNRSLLSFT